MLVLILISFLLVEFRFASRFALVTYCESLPRQLTPLPQFGPALMFVLIFIGFLLKLLGSCYPLSSHCC
jgi:hypothetical protein